MNRDDIKVGDRLVVTEDHHEYDGNPPFRETGGYEAPFRRVGQVLTARRYGGSDNSAAGQGDYSVAVVENWGYADARYLAPDDGRVAGDADITDQLGVNASPDSLTDEQVRTFHAISSLTPQDDERSDLPDAGDDGMGNYAGTDCPCIDAPGRIPLDAVRAAAALLGGPGRDLPVDAVLALAAALDADERVASEALPHTWDGDLELTADGDGPEAWIEVRQRGGSRLLVATNEGVDIDDVREAAAGHRMLLDAMTERGAR